MTTDGKLIRATYLLGLIPLTVGLSIFFSWWIGKAEFVTTFHKLERWGYLWTLISIPAGLAGLLTGLFYLANSFRTNLTKALFGIFCVLINIPVLNWVLTRQHDIDKRAYVRIYNNTGLDFKSMTIKNSVFTESFSSLEHDDYKNGYFYPNYDQFESSHPEPEKVILTITTDKEEKRILMPEIYKGECFKVFVSKDFNIEAKQN